MLVVQYIGGETNLQATKMNFIQKIKITSAENDVNAVIYEIGSLESLFKVPKKFSKPSFFYITTQDKTILAKVKEYPISGLFFPPLNVDNVLAKIQKAVSSTPVSINQEEYEALKIKALAKAENLPPLPSLAVEIIKLTRSDSSTIAQVTDKIKKDQGISSRVIKLVNSPFYGMRQEIASIDRATALLGFNSVKNLALAISIDSYFQKPFDMYNTTGKAMWSHSFKVATISQEIAKTLGNLNTEALYLAGLLHDVGKLVLIDLLVKAVNNIEDERAQLGFDHAEIGSAILAKWSVSPDICEAVRTHHLFNAPAMGKVVYYANKIADEPESANAIIDEMYLFFEIKDNGSLKQKINNFLKDFDASL